MRVIESLNRCYVHLQTRSGEFWNGMTVRKGCTLSGALALTAALVVCLIKKYKYSPSYAFLGGAAVAVAVPCAIRGCFWLKRKCVQWCHARSMARQAARAANRGSPFVLDIQTHYMREHGIRINGFNRIKMTINRLNMNFVAAREHLKVLAAYLNYYQNVPQNRDLAILGLSITYEGERGIDAGGPSREFITQLFKHLFHFPNEFPFVKQNESGQYELFDGMLTMNAQDLQVCKDIGTFLAAALTGFLHDRDAKIGNVFSSRFYNLLLSIHKYTVDHPGQIEEGFNAMTQEGKEALALQLAAHDLENPFYKEINNCLNQANDLERTDKEIDALLKFLIDSLFIEDQDPHIALGVAEILEAFRNVSNYAILLNTSEPFVIGDNEGQHYTREMIRNALRNALLDPQQKVHFQTKFACALVDVYQNICIPLVAVEAGFQSAAERIRPFLDQLEIDPHAAVSTLSTAIQGPSFTREAFVALLRRSRAERSVQTGVGWIIEWCERGVNGVEETKASEADMKRMLSCMTGTEVVTDALRLEFSRPRREQGYSEFHTCSHFVNFGSVLMAQRNKAAFILMWNEHISRAHLEGFAMA